MREPRRSPPARVICNGITPACAGTTRWRDGRAGRSGDHPRVCGNIAPHQRRDHPRVCGNHARPSFPSFSGRGSPPRVREPPAIPVRIARRIGITPACAGTTSGISPSSINYEDHPRVCGNHWPGRHSADSAAGSPPRVREPQHLEAVPGFELRITPACAGTTIKILCGLLCVRDHPRVCGNHQMPAARRTLRSGSPPRVREPHMNLVRNHIIYRITPACAGTTS